MPFDCVRGFDRSCGPRGLLILGILFSLGATGASSFPYPLDIRVATRSDKGRVYCAIWAGKQGYPKERARARYEGRSSSIELGWATLRFEVQPSSRYALACFHDENDNRSLDANFLGIPSEGTGASNDARGFMGPPRYEDARFVVTGTTSLTVRMSYR